MTVMSTFIHRSVLCLQSRCSERDREEIEKDERGETIPAENK